ncbi:MAG: hypothetical protein M4D80_33715 [Myxococcota bacterium]|nr:hypothetical protein [Myxococcota bacterium]
MGQRRQRLAVLALIVLATTNVASADNKTLARDLFNLGIDEYKAKQYDAAAASLSKSHALDPRPDALYALAQSERLAGKCKEAIPHYEQLLADSKDEKSQKKIRENIEICKQIEAGKPAPTGEDKTDAKSQERDAPTIEYRTVVRTERSRDVLSIALFAGGGVAISGGVAMFLVARSQRSEADSATTLEEYNDKYDSSRRLKWISYASAGVGVSLITVAVVRLIRGDGNSEAETKQVTLAPTQGGSILSFHARW